MRDHVEAEGLDMPEVLPETDEAQVEAKAEDHPELAGETVAVVWSTPDTFYVYEPADAPLWDPSTCPAPEDRPSAARALRDHVGLEASPDVIAADEAGYEVTMWEPGG